MPKQQGRQKTPLRRLSRSQRFFRELVDDLDLVATFGYRPTAVLKYGMQGVRRMRLAQDRKWQREAMRRLAARQLIEIEKTEHCYRIALTKAGMEEVYRIRIRDADLLPEGVTCFVVFDIPEAAKEVRQLLRRFLTDIGFAPLQKSVWICRFDVAAPLLDLLQIKGMRPWVRVFVAEER